MGLYLRKYIRIGPLRFNLSKLGIGVSAGIRGLRIASGPRGNYVHMGRHGLYYRKSLSLSSKKQHIPVSPPPRSFDTSIPTKTHEPLKEIESTEVEQLVDSSSIDLLNELKSKQRKTRFWPLTSIICITILIILFLYDAPGWFLIVSTMVILLCTSYIAWRDKLRKTTVVFYDFDDESTYAYNKLYESLYQLSQSSKIWHIEAEGSVHDRKYHAGASSLVRRRLTSIKQSTPPLIKTNIPILSLGVGRQTLYFFPDRLLLYDNKEVGAIGYQSLKIVVCQLRFIEDEDLPADAKVVDYTWKYVNKRGGPDKRFKDNVQLPICLYDNIDLISESGLNERIQISKCNFAESLPNAVCELAKSSLYTK